MIRHLFRGTLAAAFVFQAGAEESATPEAATPEAGAPETTAPAMDAATMRNDSSYALGFRTGDNFAQQFGRFGVTAEDLDGEAFMKGFLAALKGLDPEPGEEALQAAMGALGDQLQLREEQTAASNLEKGKAFLEENAKREGVVSTESGLQYEILVQGGEEKYQAPTEEGAAEKQFMVNYRGTLIDGTEFDASPEGQPVPMTLQVIDGFHEALTNMPVGAKWKLFIPSDLAYGEERRSAEIGPNSTLIFDLELLSIEDAPPAQDFPFQIPGNP